MTSKLTREERIQSLYGLKIGQVLNQSNIESFKMLARMALAAMESEPVATLDVQSRRHDGNKFALVFSSAAHKLPDDVYFLYRHAQPAPVVQYVPLGDSPYDVPYSMPSNLRELIAEEIGILFSDDDAQGVWNVCRSAAMLNGGKSSLTLKIYLLVTGFLKSLTAAKLTPKKSRKWHWRYWH